MTHAPETGTTNRLHFLAPIFGTGLFFIPYVSGIKIRGTENKYTKVNLYSVQCYALHWTDNKNFDL